jgi:hypothetical protein
MPDRTCAAQGSRAISILLDAAAASLFIAVSLTIPSDATMAASRADQVEHLDV